MEAEPEAEQPESEELPSEEPAAETTGAEDMITPETVNVAKTGMESEMI